MPDGRPAYIYTRRTVSWARVKGENIRPRYCPPTTKAGLRQNTDPTRPHLHFESIEASVPDVPRRIAIPDGRRQAHKPVKRPALGPLGRPAAGQYARAASQLRVGAHHGRRAVTEVQDTAR